MLSFILSRIAQAIPVLLAVGFIAFAMFAFVGDPVTIMLGTSYTEVEKAALITKLGLDQPFLVQYGRFMWNAAHGDFGISYRLISLIGVSLPTFLIGILLILIFSVWLGVLPSFGRGDVVRFSHWSTGFLTGKGLKALVLPAVTLGLFQMTLIMRLVRAEMLEVLRSDYVKFARARGLSDRSINFGHALRNTLVPVITIAGLQIGGIIAFSIVTETVFQWPGMGLLFIQAVQNADIPIMGAYLMLISVLFVLINLIVDLLYYAVDPRLRITRAVAGAAR